MALALPPTPEPQADCPEANGVSALNTIEPPTVPLLVFGERSVASPLSKS